MIPYTAPATVSGTAMQNQSATIETRVPKGIAPDAPAPTRKKLSRLIIAKIAVGKRREVQRIFCFHDFPPSEA